MKRSAVVYRPQSPPEDLLPIAVAADEAGLDELWVWEDCFLQGGLAMTAAALARTERLTVGIGLLPVPLRNPAVAAMEAATLARLFPGRVTLGLGHGVLDWMRQVGAGVESPMTLLREHTTAVRDLLRGETVDVRGRYVSLDSVALDWPPEVVPPLLLGARGERTIALAGELTDGVLLDSSADESAVARAREIVGPDRQVVVYAEVSPAEAAARIDALEGAGASSVVLQGTGDDPDPRPLIEAWAGVVDR